MKIIILAVGTRGDVQPYIALGLGLRREGHSVCVAAASNFESFVRGCGLDFGRLDANFRDLMSDESLQRGVESRNPFRRLNEVMRMVRGTLQRFAADTWHLCQGMDAIIFSTIAVTGYSVAEKLGVPSCWAPLTPMSRTREFPGIFMPAGLDLGRLNWLSHVLEDQIAWQPSRDFINRWRQQELGLEPFPFFGPFSTPGLQRLPVIYGFSPSVVPKPSDWNALTHVTGYWFLDQAAGWQPPAGLVEFIESGPRPVYIGFGSMINRQAQALTRIVREALVLCKQRAVVATGWDSLSAAGLPDTVFGIDSVPHEWLFPRMAAVVHHGGAGTTAAGLRAGVPSVIVPFAADQPFWAHRVYERGAGVKPIPVQRLSAERLAAAITQAVSDASLREGAAALGRAIRAEDGVQNAVQVIETSVLR